MRMSFTLLDSATSGRPTGPQPRGPSSHPPPSGARRTGWGTDNRRAGDADADRQPPHTRPHLRTRVWSDTATTPTPARVRQCQPVEQMAIRISERPTATNRHEARVPNLGHDHWLVAPSPYVRPTPQGDRGQSALSTVASFEDQGGPSLSGSLAGTPRVAPYPSTCAGRRRSDARSTCAHIAAEEDVCCRGRGRPTAGMSSVLAFRVGRRSGWSVTREAAVARAVRGVAQRWGGVGGLRRPWAVGAGVWTAAMAVAVMSWTASLSESLPRTQRECQVRKSRACDRAAWSR